jgi:hypothetical protein
MALIYCDGFAQASLYDGPLGLPCATVCSEHAKPYDVMLYGACAVTSGNGGSVDSPLLGDDDVIRRATIRVMSHGGVFSESGSEFLVGRQQ